MATQTFGTAASAGTAAITRTYDDGPIETYQVAWTSSSGGAVTIAMPPMNGIIAKVVTDPGAAAPTANWDVALTDADGFDAFGGGGADRHTSNSEAFKPFVSTTGDMPIAGASTLNITNAGNAKTGTIKIYLRK